MLIDSDTSASSDSSSDEDNDVVDVTHERQRNDGKRPPYTDKANKKRERDDHDESAAKRHKREASGSEKKTQSTKSDNGQRKTPKTHLRDSDDEQENVGADNENEHSDILLNLSSDAQSTHASGGRSQQANYLPGYSWQFVSPSAPSAPFMSFANPLRSSYSCAPTTTAAEVIRLE